MTFQHFAGAAYRALTSPKDGPSLYDVCDPLLLNGSDGDPHLRKFYKTALANPALRPLLRRAGLKELRDPSCFEALRNALVHARDDDAPDWAAIGRPASLGVPKRADIPTTVEIAAVSSAAARTRAHVALMFFPPSVDTSI